MSEITFTTESFTPVFREIPFRDPSEIYAAVRSGNSFLLESVKGPGNIARYSFIGIEPYLIMKVKDGVVEIDCGGRKTLSSRIPLQRLRELVEVYRQEPVAGLPPFQGGAAGMLSYDFVHYLEKLPETAMDDLHIPDLHFFMIDRLIAFDHAAKKCWIIVCPGARETVLGYSEVTKPKALLVAEAETVLQGLQRRINFIAETEEASGNAAYRVNITYETEKERYMDMVTKTKEYIAAGDIFQANLSLRLSAEIGVTDPWKVYTILRKINPSPFAAFVDFDDYHIVSSSPERLVRVVGKTVDTRPIAGTRPRGKDLDEDETMRAELLLNEKERAEHIMLIDLERNDLGKVSDYGTVSVDELMITEKYSHVIHIVSNVKGILVDGKDCFNVIRAAFPGGTITGVPKVRCMEIIDEIEPTKRGPYTGSIGYIGFNGNMDMNIIIRTFLIKDGRAYVQAGAGIVADSDPEREYYESLKKAEALIKTLEYL
ncbi:MAG: anthranilate synthase component I family protein [Nitrospirota bacterium]|nr:anthranilate synthase component I family protein [Nitrospirota bacterium]